MIPLFTERKWFHLSTFLGKRNIFLINGLQILINRISQEYTSKKINSDKLNGLDGQFNNSLWEIIWIPNFYFKRSICVPDKLPLSVKTTYQSSDFNSLFQIASDYLLVVISNDIIRKSIFLSKIIIFLDERPFKFICWSFKYVYEIFK